METLEQNIQPQIPIPNSTAILVLGILSIPCCCCVNGLVGLILGVIALVLYGKAVGIYNSNKDAYTDKSLSNLNAGRICAIIGTIFSALMVLLAIYIISTIGWDTMNDPEKMQEWIESFQK